MVAGQGTGGMCREWPVPRLAPARSPRDRLCSSAETLSPGTFIPSSALHSHPLRECSFSPARLAKQSLQTSEQLDASKVQKKRNLKKYINLPAPVHPLLTGHPAQAPIQPVPANSIFLWTCSLCWGFNIHGAPFTILMNSAAIQRASR